MRVVRLKMYQEMARFNNPSAPKGAEYEIIFSNQER